METIKYTYPNGKTTTFTMSKDKNIMGITKHIWVNRDGKPYRHLIPSKNGYLNIFSEYGCHGELMRTFETFSINDCPHLL